MLVDKDHTLEELLEDLSSSAGIVQKVELINFLNHAHITIPFGKNINFLGGLNGSGKSAILTAITICLGGAAKGLPTLFSGSTLPPPRHRRTFSSPRGRCSN